MTDFRLRAFLDVLAYAEGVRTGQHPLTRDDGYDVIVSGVTGPNLMSDYADHPFAGGRVPILVRRVPLLTSTASGRYQLLLRYWRAYQPILNLKDFSPASQDAVALRQMHERHADVLVMAGDVADAIKECSHIWASLPGAPYGQPRRSMDELLEHYAQSLSVRQAASENIVANP